MNPPEEPSLVGYRVAVTAARRARELCAMLRRHGATVASAPAITMIALTDDDQLRSSTEALIDNPPDIVIVTTGIGLRGWLAAAGGWGLADRLTAALSRARMVARGPKATGAVRGGGPNAKSGRRNRSPPATSRITCATSGISGRRVAVQMHGATDELGPVSGVPR